MAADEVSPRAYAPILSSGTVHCMQAETASNFSTNMAISRVASGIR